ncbi:MAG: tetratricopeptide repeat protein [Hyphomicrobiaceae bacterium]
MPRQPLTGQALLNEALTLFQRGNLNKAEKLARHALAEQPANPALLQFVANICFRQDKFAEAAQLCGKAVALTPGSAEAQYNLGTALMKLERYAEAAAAFRQALAAKPDIYDALNNLGLALIGLGQPAEAEDPLRRAIALAPDAAPALKSLGIALERQRRFAEAADGLKAALAARGADRGDICEALGRVFLNLERSRAAVEYFEMALAERPRSASALEGLGAAQFRLGRYADAIHSHKRALAIEPKRAGSIEGLASASLFSADWAQYDKLTRQVARGADSGETTLEPLVVLALTDDPAIQLAHARRYAASLAGPSPPPAFAPAPGGARIRVAYLSSDLRTHPVGLLTAGLFTHHDKSRFETYAIAWGADDGSATRRHIAAAADHFIDVDVMGDDAVARLLLDREIDIAVDLNGYTRSHRAGILMRRPAPVQVSYIGYVGTMGAPWIDYLIADDFVVPAAYADAYSEKIVSLPACYQVNDSDRPLPGPMPARRDAGLPHAAFVFCCFNATYKLNPAVFDVWMRVLGAVPDSALWLVRQNDEDGARTAANLTREAQARGISAERIVLAPHLPYAEHMSRLQCADLFLDTWPYNAGATASDALWAGVPVLTCPGRAFPSRMAGSLLNMLQLGELIAPSVEAYEATARRLATDRATVAALKAKLIAARKTSPLFDTASFTRSLEAAYAAMTERRRDGQPPAAIRIAP